MLASTMLYMRLRCSWSIIYVYLYKRHTFNRNYLIATLNYVAPTNRFPFFSPFLDKVEDEKP